MKISPLSFGINHQIKNNKTKNQTKLKPTASDSISFSAKLPQDVKSYAKHAIFGSPTLPKEKMQQKTNVVMLESGVTSYHQRAKAENLLEKSNLGTMQDRNKRVTLFNAVRDFKDLAKKYLCSEYEDGKTPISYCTSNSEILHCLEASPDEETLRNQIAHLDLTRKDNGFMEIIDFACDDEMILDFLRRDTGWSESRKDSCGNSVLFRRTRPVIFHLDAYDTLSVLNKLQDVSSKKKLLLMEYDEMKEENLPWGGCGNIHTYNVSSKLDSMNILNRRYKEIHLGYLDAVFDVLKDGETTFSQACYLRKDYLYNRVGVFGGEKGLYKLLMKKIQEESTTPLQASKLIKEMLDVFHNKKIEAELMCYMDYFSKK